MKHLRIPLIFTALIALMAMTGCNKEEGCTDSVAINYNPKAKNDDGSCVYTTGTPNSYDFENVSYSGQTSRIKLLDLLSGELKKAAEGKAVSEQNLIDIFENNGVISADKNLSDKVYSADKQLFYDYFTEIANLSSSSGGGDTIIDGRFYNADGVQIREMIEKGIMGAVFYYQATSYYLEPDKIDVDNTQVEEGKGTAMEHHFDEAFGYFGAPKDFKVNDADEVEGDYTGSAWFWAHYALGRDKVVPVRDEIFSAFLGGRAAIVNDRRAKQAESSVDYLVMRDDMIKLIKENWELLAAANVVHYLNSTISDIENNNTGDKWHHWSEGKAFFGTLKYNIDKKITDAQWTEIDNLLNTSPKNVSKQDLEDANLKIQNIYGFTNSQMLNL